MTRLRSRLPELILIIALAILFYRLLLGEVLFWGTPGLQFMPWRQMAFDQLRQGHLPLWNPLVGNGAPLLANYQTAVFYPPNWLNLILPVEHAMGWLGILHLLWAGLGMMAYLRRMGLDRFGQGVGALAFALSGYLVSRFGILSITSAAPWLPWMLWAIDGLWPAEGLALRRRVALLAATVAMQLLAGHAQTTFYSLTLAALYSIWRAAQLGKLHKLPLALSGGILAAGLAAIQLLPTVEILLNSQRSGGIEFEQALSYSFWPWRVLTWAAPNFFGSPATNDYWGYGAYWEDATYIGLPAAIAGLHAVISWLRSPRDTTRPGWTVVPFFAALIPLVLVLALGWNTPIFVWLYHNIPTFDLFQAPARWMLLAVFAMATLAGIGAHGWQLSERGIFWTRLATAGGLSMLIAALAATRAPGGIQPTFIRAMARLGITIIALGALTLTQPPPKNRRRWLWEGVMLAFLATDLIITGWGLNPTIDPAFYQQQSSLSRTLTDTFGDTRTLYLPDDEFSAKFDTFLSFNGFGPSTLEAWTPLRESLLPNLGMLDNTPSASNFDPLLVGPYSSLLTSTSEQPIGATLPRLRAMNVGALLTTRTIDQLDQIAQSGPITAYAIPDPLPRSYIVHQAQTVPSPQAALTAISHPNFDPASTVILERASVNSTNNVSAPATSNIIEQLPHTITIQTQSSADGWLVLTDTWYPGWQATLDGNRVTIIRANVAFRAITIPNGQHTIIFTYRPSSLRVGAIITLLSLAIAATLALWKKPSQDNPTQHLQ